MTETNTKNHSFVEKSADGVYLIAGSRIPLDTVVYWFHRGATAEVIADKYPSLSLASVYGSIAHYLNYRETIDLELQSAQEDAVRNKKQLTSSGQSSHLRSRLLARMNDAVPA